MTSAFDAHLAENAPPPLRARRRAHLCANAFADMFFDVVGHGFSLAGRAKWLRINRHYDCLQILIDRYH